MSLCAEAARVRRLDALAEYITCEIIAFRDVLQPMPSMFRGVYTPIAAAKGNLCARHLSSSIMLSLAAIAIGMRALGLLFM